MHTMSLVFWSSLTTCSMGCPSSSSVVSTDIMKREKKVCQCALLVLSLLSEEAGTLLGAHLGYDSWNDEYLFIRQKLFHFLRVGHGGQRAVSHAARVCRGLGTVERTMVASASLW